MDPNYDWQFGDTDCIVGVYSPPCPNGGSDVTYILRYLVKKYHWIDLEDVDGVLDFSNRVLTISIPFTRFVDKTNFEVADSSDTNVFFEIYTSLNHNVMTAT